MYRDLRVACVIPCYNERSKIASVVKRLGAVGIADQILVVDDGSTDDSGRIASRAGADVLRADQRQGVGAALRAGFNLVGKGADVIVVLAGNDKDEPKELPLLLDPIVNGEADFVQGSRFLGKFQGDIPFYRRVATRVHPWLFSLAARHRVTESTNGFRAFRARLLRDQRIRLDDAWLDEYELEPYLLYKAITLGYAFREVPVTKTYPPRNLGYTKMVPFRSWWSILRPVIFLLIRPQGR